jgi:hypothetical protein
MAYANLRFAFSGCRASHKASDSNLYTVLADVLYGVRSRTEEGCWTERNAAGFVVRRGGQSGTAMIGASGKGG